MQAKPRLADQLVVFLCRFCRTEDGQSVLFLQSISSLHYGCALLHQVNMAFSVLKKPTMFFKH
jgi:hypothetical protein